MRYTTIQDAIDREIVPSLGDYAGDYDLEAIAREAFEYQVDTDSDGNQLLNTAGFEWVVDSDDYWQIVRRHER